MPYKRKYKSETEQSFKKRMKKTGPARKAANKKAAKRK
tara:strand:- start:12728 stop:12841 length:114 start_codon:yes stop_codon:yes gene_type:complete